MAKAKFARFQSMEPERAESALAVGKAKSVSPRHSGLKSPINDGRAESKHTDPGTKPESLHDR